MFNQRTSILVANTRSLINLTRAVDKINDLTLENPVELNLVHNPETGALEHYELTGSALDLFQVGLRYGAFEERNHLLQFVSDRYRDLLEEPVEEYLKK